MALERIAAALEKLAASQGPQSQRPHQSDPAYGTSEAADRLGLNEQTVRKYCRKRVFGTQTQSGRWLIRQSEVEHFLNGQRRIHGKGVA